MYFRSSFKKQAPSWCLLDDHRIDTEVISDSASWMFTFPFVYFLESTFRRYIMQDDLGLMISCELRRRFLDLAKLKIENDE